MAKASPSSIPIALFQDNLITGNGKPLCCVLDNGKRVMAQREVVRPFTGHTKGNLDRYPDAQNLKPFINKDMILDQTIQFLVLPSRAIGNGFETTRFCAGFHTVAEIPHTVSFLPHYV